MFKRIAASLAGFLLVLTGLLSLGTLALASTCGGTGPACYYYVAGTTTSAVKHPGMYLAMDIAKPAINLAKGDYHSDAMMSVVDGNTVIEFGWNVDPGVNGDSNPHMFYFLYPPSGPAGYNTGMTLSATTGACAGGAPSGTPGQTLTYPALKKFGVQHDGVWPNGRWWFAYDTGWVGCVPDSWWVSHGQTTPFDGAYTFRNYIEVASSHDISTGSIPCAQGGNGNKGSLGAGPPAALRFANNTWSDTTATYPAMTLYTQGGASSVYDYGPLGTSGRSFYAGGAPAAGTPGC